MFAVFALAFGSMGLASGLLYLHAWRRREAIGLDALERDLTRHAMLRWAIIPLFSLASLALALWMPVIPGKNWSVSAFSRSRPAAPAISQATSISGEP